MIWDYHFWLGVASFVSCPIRFQDSLIINNLRKSQLIPFFFLRGDSHQVKVAPVTTTFEWVWPGVTFVQSDFRIFDYQSPCMKSVDILHFLHGS